MRRLAALAVLALPLAAPGLAAGLAAGGGAMSVGAAAATVVGPLAVVPLADLDFGTIAGGAAAGAVAVAPGAASALYLGGAQRVCGGGSGCAAAHAARFAVRGEALRAYSVALPGGLAVPGEMAGGGTGPVLTIDGLAVRSASRPGDGPNGRLDAAGDDSFDLGGTLHIPAGIAPGRYRVSVPVVVTYR